MLDWVFDVGLSFGRRGLVCILLGYWVVYADVLGGFSWFLPYVVHSSCNLLLCNLLVNIKGLESTFFSLSASDEAAAS